MRIFKSNIHLFNNKKVIYSYTQKSDNFKKNEDHFVVIPLLFKLTLCLISIFSFHGKTFSQENPLQKRYSIKFKNVNVLDALSKITQKTGCFFTYDARIVSENKKITYNESRKSLRYILSKVFSDSLLEYKVIKNNIAIRKRKRINVKDSIPEIPTLATTIIKGKIIDRETLEPIPFVSIGIINNIATVSNENGEFTLKIPQNLNNFSVNVSHLGYHRHVKSVTEFKPSGNVILLEKNFISLQEVIIRNNDPLLLVRTALEKKAENYPNISYILTAYYREAVKKRNEYLTFSEAVLKIYKTSYLKEFKRDRINVYKSRKQINHTKIDTAFLKLKAGLQSGLLLDLMKNPQDFLEEEYMGYYKYQTVDIVSYNDRTAHVIEFEQKKDIQECLYKGKIYIEAQSKAIIAVEFEINFSEGKYNNKTLIVKNNRRIKTKPVMAKYRLSYKKYNDKYILNHVRGDLRLKIKKKRALFASNYDTYFEMAICNIDSTKVEKFDRRKTSKLHNVFIDNNYEYDESFWGSFNYIRPEEDVDKSLTRIKLILEENKEE